ncbi:MAG: YqgE/AlgH family protein, partial [Nocardioidaceae bacterium]
MAESGPEALAAGSLLVATPSLLDPNFERAVVLLLDLDANGALGVVLNRPSEVPVGEVLPAWADGVTAPNVLFAGGPVSTDSALAVG